MALINLTPHEIVLVGATGDVVERIAPTGQVARVSVTRTSTGSVGVIEIFETCFGELEGLPSAQDGDFFVVSGLAASAAKALGRQDVLSPGELVRDPEGRVVGCRGLSRPA